MLANADFGSHGTQAVLIYINFQLRTPSHVDLTILFCFWWGWVHCDANSRLQLALHPAICHNEHFLEIFKHIQTLKVKLTA